MLRRLWKRWLWVAQKIGNFQGRIIFSVIYFVLLTPIALVFRVFGDPLALKRPPPSLRPQKGPDPTTVDLARKQS